MNPLVSIVIPAYNCQSTIFNVIKAVFQQSYDNIELVIVDDGSTDDTAKIIQSFSEVKYFYQENAGPAKARNLGAHQSKGDYIFFTDSDCIAQENWITNAVKHFDKPDVGVVAGSYGIANPNNLLAQCVYKEILYRHTHLMTQHPKSFGSYNFGVKRAVFEEVKGFNENYRFASGEDNDLSYKIVKLGYKIYFEKGALVDHYHPVSVFKYLREQFRHGFWRVKMYKAHPKMAKGDNYTFWKDIVEIPLVVLLCLSCALQFVVWPQGFFFIAACSLCLLMLIEGLFAFIFSNVILERFMLSFVMLLRSFVRTFGFSTGLLYFLLNKE